MNAKVRNTLIAMGMAGFLGLAAACSNAAASSSASSAAACSSVSSDLQSAQQQLQSDQTKAQNDKGTPDSVSANATVKSDQDKITTLTDQQKQCSTSPAATTSAPASATATPTASPLPACDPVKAVQTVLESAGFTDNQFVLGEDNFNLKLPAALSAGKGKFASTPLTTSKALVTFLGTGSPQAKAVLTNTENSSGAPQSDVLTPSHWIGFQLLVASDWTGNTSFVSNKVENAGTRHSAVGDIGYMFVNPTDCSAGKLPATGLGIGIVRMGCGNPQTSLPVPAGHKPVSIPKPKPTPKPTPSPTPSPAPTPTPTPPPRGCQQSCFTPPPTHCPCVSPTQVQIPVQEPGEPTSGTSNVPIVNGSASPPAPVVHPSTTPSTGNDNGFGTGSTASGSAPPGSTDNGGSTQSGNPTPSSSPICDPSLGCGQQHDGGGSNPPMPG